MSKRKLLLADDSITIQKVVNLTFADEGIEVISVGDGNSAMDKLREDMPDLVMADVNMPGLNGYEICENIKKSGNGGSDTPVILLVGSFEPFDEEEATRVGADDYLTKPFQSISQLVEKVTGLLKLEDESFEDTAEMPDESIHARPISEDESGSTVNDTPQFQTLTDDFNDDEMIQTAQVGSVPIDDTAKYESTSEIPGFEPENQFDEETVDIEEPDFNKTQPLTQSDYQELAVEEPEVETGEFKGASYVNEPVVEEESSIHSNIVEDASNETGFEITTTESFDEVDAGQQIAHETASDDLPMPEAASILELDEMNLLDLPPLEVMENSAISDGVDTVKSQGDDSYSAREKTAITAKEFTEIADEIDEEVSPETVKVIAEKIMERVSEKEVRQVAWEVVPELAELIIRKMAEEKLKD